MQRQIYCPAFSEVQTLPLSQHVHAFSVLLHQVPAYQSQDQNCCGSCLPKQQIHIMVAQILKYTTVRQNESNFPRISVLSDKHWHISVFQCFLRKSDGFIIFNNRIIFSMSRIFDESKCVQNPKSFWRPSQNQIILSLLSRQNYLLSSKLCLGIEKLKGIYKIGASMFVQPAQNK